MPQSDEPPRAAVEAVVSPLGSLAAARDRLAALRALPDVWPLIAWLAQGREPTEAMRAVMQRQSMHTKTLAQLLAAAAQREGEG